ncbi:ABC transporter substrate-binding protein [Piscinibacter sp. XHJ-5]|uniref:ABC transporter substrate-binding protein n=1 Tax=Piscinibacter sp. XHJ-5 TaxID=3037797 RepID=UPI0024535655|nr:ABC transporter substrate-binding protein [Piscinibacter sp. XHJ-5]
MLSRWVGAAAVVIGMAASPGAGAANGVTDHEIRIGASVVLSGPLGPQTADYGAGSRLYFDSVNAAGGVHGRKIVYRTLDDAFDVQRAVENTRQLLERDKVFLIYNNTGTAHTAAILPIAAEARTVVFGPVTGASALRQTFHRHLFHVRAGYADEAARITRQLHEMGITRVAAFFQDDAFGKALLTEVKKAAAAQRLEIVAEASVDPKAPAFEAAAATLGKAAPQAVVMCTAGSTFTGLVKALGTTGTRPGIYGFSVVSVDQTTRDLGAAARGIVLAQVMPSLANRANPVVDEYLSLASAKGDAGPPSQSKFEGFVHARVLVEGLRRAGRDLSTDHFIRGLESAGEVSFGKFSAHYSPSSHSGSAYVELAIIDTEGKLRY